MTSKKLHKINTLPTTVKTRGYRRVHEGYDKSDNFIMSDDVTDWYVSKVRKDNEKNKGF